MLGSMDGLEAKAADLRAPAPPGRSRRGGNARLHSMMIQQHPLNQSIGCSGRQENPRGYDQLQIKATDADGICTGPSGETTHSIYSCGTDYYAALTWSAIYKSSRAWRHWTEYGISQRHLKRTPAQLPSNGPGNDTDRRCIDFAQTDAHLEQQRAFKPESRRPPQG